MISVTDVRTWLSQKISVPFSAYWHQFLWWDNSHQSAGRWLEQLKSLCVCNLCPGFTRFHFACSVVWCVTHFLVLNGVVLSDSYTEVSKVIPVSHCFLLWGDIIAPAPTQTTHTRTETACTHTRGHMHAGNHRQAWLPKEDFSRRAVETAF